MIKINQFISLYNLPNLISILFHLRDLKILVVEWCNRQLYKLSLDQTDS
jgi:hypothetical protein